MSKVLVSCCATAPGGGELKLKGKCIMSNDVRRAYLYANVRSDTFVEIPAEYMTEEDKAEDNVAMLKLSMYGTRETASAWQGKVRDVVEQLGFQVSMTNHCICKQKPMDVECMVHGDDFISVGIKSSLDWFRDGLAI